MHYPETNEKNIEKAYQQAKERYAEYNIDTDAIINKMANVTISMHCWQGDDVGGFETAEGELSGGIMATGNHPGKAHTPAELRQDIEMAFSLIPGPNQLNLHACYREDDGKFIDRNEISASNFAGWIDWAKEKNIGLDFNPTFFSHPKAASGMTLSHPDESIRNFWIEHGKRSREIAAAFSEALDKTVINSFWIPDGAKDLTVDRWGARERLTDSYDKIFADKIDPRVKEAVESKLFGIGSEEFVVGSHEYYMGYAITRDKMLCLDMGHFHPTETIHDKLSAILTFIPEVLLHVSRPIRWDSDHVVILNDDLFNLAREIVRGNAFDRVHLATDFFDASICRIGAWAIGLRATQEAILKAMLEPVELLKQLELENAGAEKLALMEIFKSMPSGAVWDQYCLQQNVPVGAAWLNVMTDYEKNVLAKR